MINEDMVWEVPPNVDSTKSEFVKFSGAFDSGNCGPVKMVGPWQFELSPVPDCAGEEWETHSRTWFHFAVSNVPRNQKIQFTISNMNNQKSLYENGFKPVFRTNSKWTRIPGAVYFEAEEKTRSSIQFSHKFLGSRKDTTYFAFTYPYSYTDCQNKLYLLSSRHRASGISSNQSSEEDHMTVNSSGQAIQLQPQQNESSFKRRVDEDGIYNSDEFRDVAQRSDGQQKSQLYFHQDCLILSLKGRRVDILTVTNTEKDRVPIFENQNIESLVAKVPGIFPYTINDKTKGPERFPGKPIIFVSSRVHPGETPASFCMDGFLDFLLDKSDPRASKLRDMFVFKLVPMLNPDGVALGHYRSDTNGVNLNRFYHDPSPTAHPSIAAVCSLLQYYSNRSGSSSLFFYLDMHAHASKRGCFLFGNFHDHIDRQIETIKYSHLVAINTPYLDVGACDFSQKNMSAKDKRDDSVSKEGSGRVATYKSTGITHCYTLECNYNCGKALNDITSAKQISNSQQITTNKKIERSKSSRKPTSADTREREQLSGRCVSPEKIFSTSCLQAHNIKYDPDCWRSVGKACAVSILDLQRKNEWSRLENSKYKSHQNLELLLRKRIEERRNGSTKILRKRSSKKTIVQSLEKFEQMDINSLLAPQTTRLPALNRSKSSKVFCMPLGR